MYVNDDNIKSYVKLNNKNKTKTAFNFWSENRTNKQNLTLPGDVQAYQCLFEVFCALRLRIFHLAIA